MANLSTNELSRLLVWAFREERVESAVNPHIDALTLYCNVMALPVPEAATVIRHARLGAVPPSDPIDLARWTRGLSLLSHILAQPMSHLSTDLTERTRTGRAA